MRDKNKVYELMDILADIWDDKDFVLGVCAHLKSDDHIQKMIDWLNKHKNETIESDEILLKAMEIRYGTKLYIEGLETRD